MTRALAALAVRAPRAFLTLTHAATTLRTLAWELIA